MKKTLFLILLVIPFLLAACSKEESSLINLSETELADNQTIVTGQVTSRIGNDIELALGSAQTQFNTGAMPSGEAGAMPSGERGAMPSGDRGAMPSGAGRMNGDGGAGNASGGDIPTAEDGAVQDASTSGGTAAADAGTQIQLSGETMSLTIPVGTSVLVTSNGTLSASSFGRIQADDILQLIVQTNADGSQTVTLAQIME